MGESAKNPEEGTESGSAEQEAWEPVAPEPVAPPPAPEPFVAADEPPAPLKQGDLGSIVEAETGIVAGADVLEVEPSGSAPAAEVRQAVVEPRWSASSEVESSAPATPPIGETPAPITKPSVARRVLRGLLIAWIAVALVMLVGSGVYAAVRGDWRDVSYVILAIIIVSGIILEDRRRKRAKGEAPQPSAEEEAAAPEPYGGVPVQPATGSRRPAQPSATTAGSGASAGLRVMAALLSAVIPGAGLIVRRRFALGLFVLLGCLALFSIPVGVEMLGAPESVVGPLGLFCWAGVALLYVLGIAWSAMPTKGS